MYSSWLISPDFIERDDADKCAVRVCYVRDYEFWALYQLNPDDWELVDLVSRERMQSFELEKLLLLHDEPRGLQQATKNELNLDRLD